MKKSLFFLILLFVFFPVLAQNTQTGYVKTKGRMDKQGNLIPGTRIGNVAIQLTGGHSTVAGANGDFKLTAPSQKFCLTSVQKQGYTLIDPDVLKKQYVCSANPLVISMETIEKMEDDKLVAERKLRRQLQKQLQQKEEEIDALKEENKLTEEEYRKVLNQLYAEQESNERLVSDMAKRYAELDYDLLDEFYRQVTFCIENGDLVKADSLLRSRGDLNQQVEELKNMGKDISARRDTLNKAKAVYNAEKEETARRCYSFFEKFSAQFLNDSAAYYLELRANLDTTNVQWQNETGSFIKDYLADYNKALSYYERALRQSIRQNNNIEVATSYNGIGLLCSEKRECDSALKYFQKALDIIKSIHGEKHPDAATCYENMGIVYGEQGAYAKEKIYLHKALNIRESIYGRKHSSVATSYNNIGSMYDKLGKYATALNYFQKSLFLRESIYGENNEYVATCYNNIGLVYNNKGSYDKAMEYYQKALSIQNSIYAENHPYMNSLYNNIGLAYYFQENYESALEYYQKALSADMSIYGKRHPNVALGYNNMGCVYSIQEKYDMALECFQKALDIYKSFYGEDHPSLATCYNNIGNIYYTQKKYDKVMALLKKALDIYMSSYGKDHPKTQLLIRNIEKVKSKMNEEE